MIATDDEIARAEEKMILDIYDEMHACARRTVLVIPPETPPVRTLIDEGIVDNIHMLAVYLEMPVSKFRAILRDAANNRAHILELSDKDRESLRKAGRAR